MTGDGDSVGHKGGRCLIGGRALAAGTGGLKDLNMLVATLVVVTHLGLVLWSGRLLRDPGLDGFVAD